MTDRESNRLLGMTGLIHAATVAVVSGVRPKRLAHAVPCFPTRSEVFFKFVGGDGFGSHYFLVVATVRDSI